MSTTTTPTPSTTPPATVPASQVIPFPLPWGGIPCPPIPGCAPGCGPAGMDALMKCYMDIKNAMAFISKVMIDLINNDPAVAQAMIAAIEKSGSSLPLIGVTNGADAQPGQVGEYVQLSGLINVPVGNATSTASLGVLPPGDWDCWMWFGIDVAVDTLVLGLDPLPAGFANNVSSNVYAPTPEAVAVGSVTGRALTSVPSLIAYQLITTAAAAAGVVAVYFAARRRR